MKKLFSSLVAGLIVLLTVSVAMAGPPAIPPQALTPSAIASAGGALLAPRPNTIVLFGHSFVDYNGTADTTFGSAGTPPISGTNAQTFSKGMFNQMNIALNNPFTVLAKQGVVGNTSTQCLARFSQAVALNPGWIWLDCNGTNDPYSGISVSTSEANIDTMINMALAKGIRVILPLDLPRGGTYTQSNIQSLITISNYLLDKYGNNPGVIVMSPWPLMADTSTYAATYNGTPLASMFLADAIHPNALGAITVGQWEANYLRYAITPYRRQLIAGGDSGTNGDLSIMTRNPKLSGTGGFTGTAGSGSWAANTFSGRTTGTGIAGVGSKVTRASLAATFPGLFDDGAQGEVQAIALSGAAAATDVFYHTVSPGNLTTFATFAGTGPYVVTAEVAAVASSGTITTLDVGCSFGIASASPWLIATNYNADSGDYLNVTKYQGTITSRPFYLPVNLDTTAGTQFCQVRMGTSTGGTATVYVANFGLRKVQN